MSGRDRRKPYLAMFLLATAMILIVTTWPWSNFDAVFHWNRVVWFPFGEKQLNWLDIILNVILFMPFGYCFIAFGPKKNLKRMWVCILFAALLSLFVETVQGFGVRRFPSSTDVASNVIGAFLGSLVVWWNEQVAKRL